MAIGFDAASISAVATTNLSWTHTPAGTPRGVLVFGIQLGSQANDCTCTYGGTPVPLLYSNSATANVRRIYIFYLGTGVPTGAQTVVLTVGSAVSRAASAITVTAATNTELSSYMGFKNAAAGSVNGFSIVNKLFAPSFMFAVIGSGEGSVASVTTEAGMTRLHAVDFGSNVAVIDRSNTLITTGYHTASWTQSAATVAAACVGVSEVFTKALPSFTTEQQAVVDAMLTVNNKWMLDNFSPGDADWDRSTYNDGLLAFYKIYPHPTLFHYLLEWAVQAEWKIFASTAYLDRHKAIKVYYDLASIEPALAITSYAKTELDAVISAGDYTLTSWVDSLFMTLPSYAYAGVLESLSSYFDAMGALYAHCKFTEAGLGLWSEAPGRAYGHSLWFRDDTQDPPAAAPNADLIYWSRGNGWALGAHVQVLETLPSTHEQYEELVATFQAMAAALKDLQLPSGFWPVSLRDPTHAQTLNATHVDAPEASGTAFFVYGLTWGINAGLLSSAVYLPIVELAWAALTGTAIQGNGVLGWVQSSALSPTTGQPFTATTTADYAVGAFLLAGTELVKFYGTPIPPPPPPPPPPEAMPGAIKLEYPLAMPSTTIFLRPGEAGIIILRDAVQPAQWLEEAVDGSVTFKQLGSYRKERWRVQFTYLLDVETGAGLSGFDALRTFLETTVNQGANVFRLTDRDGESLTCRLIPGSFHWERGQGGLRYKYVFGSFSVVKVA